MGGASKFILLLTTPLSLFHPCPSLFRLARHSRISLAPLSTAPHRLALCPLPRPQSLLPIKASQQFHTQTNNILKEDHISGESLALASHPWPEWSQLVETLSAGGYFDRHIIGPEDEFLAYETLSEEFVRAASACLGFARDRPDILGLLSRRDIEVLVENGAPFLFKSAGDNERRMRSFLGSSGSYVVESDKAQTVDLMKYILSYARNHTVSSKRNNIYSGEVTESSVRYLLRELADVSCRVPASDMSAPEQYQVSDRYVQTPRPLGPNIEMKRGDWICPKCSFMNFARNTKCLECEEPRPKRQLTGGEWDCPQCGFFNYGRNLMCLRCDCKQPGEASLGGVNSRSGLGYMNGDYANRAAVDSRLATNEEKAQHWFSKDSQLKPAPDLNNGTADEDFPEIMPLRKGGNRFVVSTRKTPLDRRFTNSQYQNNLGDGGIPESNDSQGGGTNRTLDTSISRSLDQILGRTSTVSGTDNKSITAGQNAGTDGSPPLSRAGSSQYGNPKGSNSSYVPFVPLPAGMFAKKPQKSTVDNSEEAVMKSSELISSKANDETGTVTVSNESVKLGESFQSSEKPTSQADRQIKEREQEEKSERWFKKIAELHDATDLTSAISDEDFPEIMPMRKGENRFVISKKKDRSLTSPTYKRQKAMEQGGNSQFVPFVPFPPDYFTKKDKQQPESTDTIVKPTDETSFNNKSHENSNDATPGMTGMNHVQGMENQQTGTEKLRSKYFVDYGGPTSGNPTSNSYSSKIISSSGWNTSANETTSETLNVGESPQQPAEKQNVRSEWTGKSLEGSAVKEPDPLDMSEEAKAERWFRRVAQIKDISELSQIPDEDFPSIMPMRKGVNRFVVSKRKTPLERRLTSPQYRKNLRIVSSDPLKKENDSS